MGHSNAIVTPLYYDAVSQTSRFGMEIARPLRAPFAKGDDSCIMWVRDFINKTLWIPACAEILMVQFILHWQYLLKPEI